MTTPTHELIDKDDPRCLYCDGEVDVELKGNWSTALSARHDVEVLRCRKCREVFEIHSMQDSTGETHYGSFVFTCGKYCIQNAYSSDRYVIGNHSLLFQEVINPSVPETTKVDVPNFSIDFSDKEKLLAKLGTYLLFS